jgi:putative ATPase
MMDLFDEGPRDARTAPHTPLAARMRPRTLDEFVGQEQILGPGSLLRRAIEEDALTSVIFYGPPGVGKSTLAGVIAGTTKAHFENFSAVTGGVPELRKAIDAAAQRRKLYGKKTVLFVDEIHRFNKSQQDALLPHVENGTFVLIGATTENPYFEVNAPLLSRARVFTFKRLSDEDIAAVIDSALADAERGLGSINVEINDDARRHLIDKSEGDARTALNALEAAALITRPESRKKDARRVITAPLAEEALQRRVLLYDKTGDNHYDTISAFIKSVRGTDPDAALYYLAKMLTAGEDARFIARRLVILASEDIGNADPMGLSVATAAPMPSSLSVCLKLSSTSLRRQHTLRLPRKATPATLGSKGRLRMSRRSSHDRYQNTFEILERRRRGTKLRYQQRVISTLTTTPAVMCPNNISLRVSRHKNITNPQKTVASSRSKNVWNRFLPPRRSLTKRIQNSNRQRLAAVNITERHIRLGVSVKIRPSAD